jgi:hypothetical protein
LEEELYPVKELNPVKRLDPEKGLDPPYRTRGERGQQVHRRRSFSTCRRAQPSRLVGLKERNGQRNGQRGTASGQSNEALQFIRETVLKVDTIPSRKAGVATSRHNEALKVLNEEAVDKTPIFKGAKGTCEARVLDRTCLS